MESKKFILIIEDDSVTGRLLQSVLTAKGYDICLVTNGIEALVKLKERVPDLVISDVIMPRMHGYAFFKELKNDPNLAVIPVMILTAHGDMQESFLELGADDFLVKPFVTEILLQKVNTLLTRNQGAIGGFVPKKLEVKEEDKKPYIPGLIMAGVFVLIIIGACFLLFKHFMVARQNAMGVGQKLLENDKVQESLESQNQIMAK